MLTSNKAIIQIKIKRRNNRLSVKSLAKLQMKRKSYQEKNPPKNGPQDSLKYQENFIMIGKKMESILSKIKILDKKTKLHPALDSIHNSYIEKYFRTFGAKELKILFFQDFEF